MEPLDTFSRQPVNERLWLFPFFRKKKMIDNLKATWRCRRGGGLTPGLVESGSESSGSYGDNFMFLVKCQGAARRNQRVQYYSREDIDAIGFVPESRWKYRSQPRMSTIERGQNQVEQRNTVDEACFLRRFGKQTWTPRSRTRQMKRRHWLISMGLLHWAWRSLSKVVPVQPLSVWPVLVGKGAEQRTQSGTHQWAFQVPSTPQRWRLSQCCGQQWRLKEQNKENKKVQGRSKF